MLKSFKTREEREEWLAKQAIKDKDYNIRANFEQYGLTKKSALELVRIDLAQTYAWRFGNSALRTRPVLDAIICDPPYGIRVGARKIGKDPSLIVAIPEDKQYDHIPSRVEYKVDEMMQDLFEFAAKSIVVGGRLIYFWHCGPEFKESDLPTHECFTLVSNSVDKMTVRQHRRLITMEKVKEV
jgi:tRNA (guanine10-N2)-methyltransferase